MMIWMTLLQALDIVYLCNIDLVLVELSSFGVKKMVRISPYGLRGETEGHSEVSL